MNCRPITQFLLNSKRDYQYVKWRYYFDKFFHFYKFVQKLPRDKKSRLLTNTGSSYSRCIRTRTDWLGKEGGGIIVEQAHLLFIQNSTEQR